VFAERFITVLRMSAAFLAGLNGMRRPKFIVANAAGGLLWSGGWAIGAYFLGSAATSLRSVITVIGLAATTMVPAVLAIAMRRSMGRLRQRADQAYPDVADTRRRPGPRANVTAPKKPAPQPPEDRHADGPGRRVGTVIGRKPFILRGDLPGLCGD
jgi:uncharacterized membrane protein YdfJ with MMPL/SSD domain